MVDSLHSMLSASSDISRSKHGLCLNSIFERDNSLTVLVYILENQCP